MDDRKPREELITDILFALSRGGRTIRQVEWNHNSLVALNYNELIRLWIETAPMRLNLNDSTDFLEEGISNAERHARISLFAWSLPSDRRANIIIDLIEKLLIEHELSTSSSELAESWKGALFSLNELTLGLRKKEREKRSIGGRRHARRMPPNKKLTLCGARQNAKDGLHRDSTQSLPIRGMQSRSIQLASG